MNTETITSIEQILSAIAQILPYAALAAAARRLPQATNTLHRLAITPRGRHRQGRGRHTK